MTNYTDRRTARSGAILFLLLGLTTPACVDPELDELDLDDDDDGDADAPQPRAWTAPKYPDAYMQDDDGALLSGPTPYFTDVVAASETKAAQEGKTILAAKGDAIEAAVVVQGMLNVVEPQSSGIGGGGLWLIYRAKTAKTSVIDCRERAPATADKYMLADDVSTSLKETSGVSVGVPGTLHCMNAALALLKQEEGKAMSLKDALLPAFNAANTGITVSSRLATDSNSSRLKNEIGNPLYDEARKVFRPGGTSLVAGQTLAQGNLAKTLAAVSQSGLNAFYQCGHTSGIADALLYTAQHAHRSAYPDGGSLLTCADLESYAPVTNSLPIQRKYGNYTVVTTPAPSSGMFLLQMLGMLERFDFGKPGYKFGDFYTLNVTQEAMRLAFADRAMWLGDPLKVYVPTTGLLSKQYVDLRSNKITPGKRLASVTAGDPRPYDSGASTPTGQLAHKEAKDVDLKGTTHFVTADVEGNIVSVTSTISDTWGPGLMARGCGFMLNNQLMNFNDTPQASTNPYNPGANDVAGGKRPRTTLAPTIVFLGNEPIAAFGSPGGTSIINTVLEFMIDLADFRMKLQAAVAAARYSLDSPSSSASTDVETGFPSTSVKQSLSKLGYKFSSTSAIGAVQAVLVNPKDDRKYATADPRRIGAVAGIP